MSAVKTHLPNAPTNDVITLALRDALREVMTLYKRLELLEAAMSDPVQCPNCGHRH